MNYKVLAWDDDPSERLLKLIDRLGKVGVHVTLTTQTDEFLFKFDEDFWDFVILDVIDSTSDPEFPHREAGLDLAGRVRQRNKRIPIVFITSDGGVFAEERPTPGPVLYRSKDNLPSDLVNDIMDFARANVFDSKKVFIVYGHNRKSGNIKSDVIKRLEDVGLEVRLISPEDSMLPLMNQLVEKMAQCGCFVAICTPDDKVNEEWYQPRQNVLLEIGIVMGMAYGLERLILLQRWGNAPSEMAQLPSDLAGALAIRFHDNHEDALDDLVRGLKARGLQIREEAS